MLPSTAEQIPFWFHSTIVQAASAVFAIVGTIVVFLKQTSFSRNDKIEFDLKLKLEDFLNKEMYRKLREELNFKFESPLSIHKLNRNEIKDLFKDRYGAMIEARGIRFSQMVEFDGTKQEIAKLEYEILTEILNLLLKLLVHLDVEWKYPIPWVFLLLGTSIICSSYYLFLPGTFQVGWFLTAINIVSILGFILGLTVIGLIIVSISKK